LPGSVEENLYHLTSEERKEMGVESLPDSLGEAIAVTAKSELVRKALGEHVFTRFIALKKKEWEKYRMVTRHELEEYLSIL